MKSALSTASALIAALSTLTSAAPMPNAQGSSNQAVTIVLQLQGFDAAATLSAQLDATTTNSRKAKSAAVSQQGPWCAGFSDAGATQPVPVLEGDGIFDSENEAVYSNGDAVTVGSFWCAATRGEVENFVARAIAGNKNNEGAADNKYNVNAPAAGNNGNGDAQTVRVQIELERQTTFVQAELSANIGQVTASGNLASALSVVVLGNDGACQFFDARGNQLDVSSSSSGASIAAYSCTV